MIYDGSLWFSRAFGTGEESVELVLIFTAKEFSLSLIEYTGRWKEIKEAIDKGQGILDQVSLVCDFIKLPYLLKAIPKQLKQGESLPDWSFFKSSVAQTCTYHTMLYDYTWKRASSMPFLLPQFVFHYTSISLMVCFCLILDYHKDKTYEYPPPTTSYKAPFIDDDMLHYMPELWQGKILSIAADTNLYTPVRTSYIMGFEWIWGGQTLHEKHVVVDTSPGFVSLYEPLNLVTKVNEYQPGELRTIGRHNAEYDNLFEYDYDSYLSGGKLINKRLIHNINGFLFPADLPVLQFPLTGDGIPRKTGKVLFPVLLSFGGVVLGTGLSLPVKSLGTERDVLIIEGEEVNVNGESVTMKGV